jgi:hypothetical protein
LLPPDRRLGVRVGEIIPTGFDAYVRIFHPAREGDAMEPRLWSELPERNGRVAHPEMQLEHIVGSLTSAGSLVSSRRSRGVSLVINFERSSRSSESSRPPRPCAGSPFGLATASSVAASRCAGRRAKTQRSCERENAISALARAVRPGSSVPSRSSRSTPRLRAAHSAATWSSAA